MLRVSDTARRDLVQSFVYLTEQTSVSVADRFFENAQLSFEALSQNPLLGQTVPSPRPELSSLRQWRIKGFAAWSIFYLVQSEGVRILRVLHTAQSWWPNLEVMLGLSDNE